MNHGTRLPDVGWSIRVKVVRDASWVDGSPSVKIIEQSHGKSESSEAGVAYRAFGNSRACRHKPRGLFRLGSVFLDNLEFALAEQSIHLLEGTAIGLLQQEPRISSDCIVEYGKHQECLPSQVCNGTRSSLRHDEVEQPL